MAYGRPLIRTKYSPDINWKDVERLFGIATGTKIWCDHRGDYVDIYTDGDPRECMVDLAIAGILAMVMLEMEEYGGCDREANARMN